MKSSLLVSTIRAHKETAEQASENFELPLEVIQEALVYYEQNKALIPTGSRCRTRCFERGLNKSASMDSVLIGSWHRCIGSMFQARLRVLPRSGLGPPLTAGYVAENHRPEAR